MKKSHEDLFDQIFLTQEQIDKNPSTVEREVEKIIRANERDASWASKNWNDIVKWYLIAEFSRARQ